MANGQQTLSGVGNEQETGRQVTGVVNVDSNLPHNPIILGTAMEVSISMGI